LGKRRAGHKTLVVEPGLKRVKIACDDMSETQTTTIANVTDYVDQGLNKKLCDTPPEDGLLTIKKDHLRRKTSQPHRLKEEVTRQERY
jgi:hypothetical protein